MPYSPPAMPNSTWSQSGCGSVIALLLVSCSGLHGLADVLGVGRGDRLEQPPPRHVVLDAQQGLHHVLVRGDVPTLADVPGLVLVAPGPAVGSGHPLLPLVVAGSWTVELPVGLEQPGASEVDADTVRVDGAEVEHAPAQGGGVAHVPLGALYVLDDVGHAERLRQFPTLPDEEGPVGDLARVASGVALARRGHVNEVYHRCGEGVTGVEDDGFAPSESAQHLQGVRDELVLGGIARQAVLVEVHGVDGGPGLGVPSRGSALTGEQVQDDEVAHL